MRPLTWALKEVDPVSLHRQSGIHAQEIYVCDRSETECLLWVLNWSIKYSYSYRLIGKGLWIGWEMLTLQRVINDIPAIGFMYLRSIVYY